MKTEIPPEFPAPKGKRTKRPRPSSSADHSRNSSPATSTCTEEDEDMANCLILLARGITPPPQVKKSSCRKVGIYVYECKTCNRTFPSFQALGGHRASHKRPKLAADSIDRLVDYNLNCVVKPKPKSPGSPKIHECSVCGSEFASGQALGGHMRRHRAVASAGIVEEPRKALGLDLDLNLPAPPEAEDRVSGSPRRFWRW